MPPSLEAQGLRAPRLQSYSPICVGYSFELAPAERDSFFPSHNDNTQRTTGPSLTSIEARGFLASSLSPLCRCRVGFQILYTYLYRYTT